MRSRTVAALRTDPQPLIRGRVLLRLKAPAPSAAGSASCAASVCSPALAPARDACARALAVPLEHLSSPRRAVARRRWYRPAREPLPPEPGRLVVCALLSRARRARGCSTPGDDRLETRAYAVKRYLFRLGHAARSGRFACSLEQLVMGLAPVMGWGTVPAARVRAGAVRARASQERAALARRSAGRRRRRA